MMRLSKGMFIGGGALALVASLLNLVAPKAVRGAAPAVQVQVENATTAPALTLDISRSASQQVELFCNALVGCVVPGNTSAYTVPAGRNLVVTSADVFGAGGGGGSGLGINLNVGTGVALWSVPDDGFTHQFLYPNGIVLPAGYEFSASTGNVSVVYALAYLHGYLTPI